MRGHCHLPNVSDGVGLGWGWGLSASGKHPADSVTSPDMQLFLKGSFGSGGGASAERSGERGPGTPSTDWAQGKGLIKGSVLSLQLGAASCHWEALLWGSIFVLMGSFLPTCDIWSSPFLFYTLALLPIGWGNYDSPPLPKSPWPPTLFLSRDAERLQAIWPFAGALQLGEGCGGRGGLSGFGFPPSGVILSTFEVLK